MYVVQKLATLFPLRCLVFGLGVVGVALLVFCLVAWFCVLLLCVSAWWNRGILDEVTKASYGRAVTGTAVMARSANEEKKKKALKSFYRPTLSITARCTGFNTFILSVMPYTISYFGLTTADRERHQLASS